MIDGIYMISKQWESIYIVMDVHNLPEVCTCLSAFLRRNIEFRALLLALFDFEP